MGEESLMGEVGESRSREPVEPFVRFFLRKPRVGIRAAVEECCHALARLLRAAGAGGGSGAECAGNNGGYERRGVGIGAAAAGARGIGRRRRACEAWRAAESEEGGGWRVSMRFASRGGAAAT